MRGRFTHSWCLGALVLTWILVGTVSPGAKAAEPAAQDAAEEDPDETGWLKASVGLSIGDTISINSRPYRPGFDPAPTFSVGWSWRVASFDVGLSVEHVPGANSSTFEGQPIRLGDQVGVLATLRYRYAERPWGGFYTAVSPGLGISMTTETLRGAIALNEGGAPQDVALLGIGFSVESSTGFFTRLSETVQFLVEASVITTLGSLEVADESLGYERYRARFRAGLEWRL
jgi:hypothetical protein